MRSHELPHPRQSLTLEICVWHAGGAKALKDNVDKREKNPAPLEDSLVAIEHNRQNGAGNPLEVCLILA